MRAMILVAVLVSACSSAVAPSASIAGTWAQNFTIPGPSLVVTIDARGDGTGTYAIEAGRSGTLQIAGTLQSTTVTLVFRYDYGVTRTFTGSQTDATHLSGVFDDRSAAVFTRR